MAGYQNGPIHKKWDTFNILLVAAAGMFALFIVSPLLDAILVTGGRDNMRRAACESNMNQLGLAVAQYAQDSDGELPPIRQAFGKGTWREALYPFVKSITVYRC